ncbi:MAG: hypothetical protein F6K36_11650 [Symploca sp. SIO3C6]|nr:hypothetical protein [Symploca sp. SIO3C6]NET07644.1 hypothetical protein [Symploca sp. SIO2B6]NET53137.1 hypothetical protein [Merismopedia sp. SIO2A8]
MKNAIKKIYKFEVNATIETSTTITVEAESELDAQQIAQEFAEQSWVSVSGAEKVEGITNVSDWETRACDLYPKMFEPVGVLNYPAS